MRINRVLTVLFWPFRKVFHAIRWSLEKLVAGIIWVLLAPWRILHGIVATFKMLWMATCALGRFAIALPGNLWRGLRATPRLIWRGLRTLVRWLLIPPRLAWRGIVAVGRMIRRSPRATYESLRRRRDWLLAKVEYLNSESAKWKMLFNVVKSPFSLLRSLGFSPSAAATMLFGATAVTGGVVVNEVVFAEKSFARGDPGVFLAPSDAPVFTGEEFNTLRIDLGSTPVREITIEDVSIGTVFTGSALPSGEQNAVQIGGQVTNGAFNGNRLEVGHLIFEKSRCKKLELSDIQAHTITIRGNASDGQSLAPSPGTSRMLAIGGGHFQAEAMVTSGGLYDRLVISAATSGVNGRIDKLTLSNLFTKGGPCVLTRLTIGTLEILLNEVGIGDGFATKEFTVATNVTGANISITDNVEVTIAEPATQ